MRRQASLAEDVKKREKWGNMLETLVKNCKIPQNNKKYSEKLEWLMSRFGHERGLTVDNKKAINSLDYKSGKLVFSVLSGDIMVYQINEKKTELLQVIEPESEENIDFIEKELSLSEKGDSLFVLSDNEPLSCYFFDEGEGKFKKQFEIEETLEIDLRTSDWNEKDELLATGGILTDLVIWQYDSEEKTLKKKQVIEEEIQNYRLILFAEDDEYLVVEGEMDHDRTKLIVYAQRKNGKFTKMKELIFKNQTDKEIDPISISKDGKYIFRATENHSIEVYQMLEKEKDYRLEQEVFLEESEKSEILVTSLEYVDQLNSVMAYCNNGVMKVFELSQEKFVQGKSFKIHDDFVTNSTYCKTTGILISGSQNAEIKIRNIQNLEDEELNLKGFLQVFETDTSYDFLANVISCEFSEKLETILLCDDKGEYVVMNHDKEGKYQVSKTFEKFDEFYEQEFSMSVSQDGKYFIYGFKSDIYIEKKITEPLKMEFGQKNIFKEIEVLGNDSEKEIRVLKFFPNTNNKFLSAGDDGLIKIWVIQEDDTVKLFQELDGHKGPIFCADIHPDGRSIISASKDRTVKIWGSSGYFSRVFEENYSINTKREDVFSIKISLKKDFFITTTQGQLRVHKIDHRKNEFKLSATHTLGYEKSIKLLNISLSPDGKYLMTLDTKNRAKFWHIEEDHLTLIPGYSEEIEFIAFSKNWDHSIFIKFSDEISIVPLDRTPDVQNNYNCIKYYQRLFNDDIYFMNKEALESLIEYIKGQNSMFVEANETSEYSFKFFQNLLVHSKSGLLMICVASGFDDLLAKSLEYFGYSPFFYKQKYDPFEAALELNFQNNLDIFAEYFKKHLPTFKSIFTMQLFNKMMISSSSNLQELAKNVFFGEGRQADIKIPSMYPVDEKEGYMVIDHYSSQRDLDFRDTLVKKADFDNAPLRVEFSTLPFPADLNLWSNFSTQYLDMMYNIPEHFLMTELRYIVREIWKRNIYFIWIYTLLAWLRTAFFCYIMIWDDSSLIFTIPTLVLNIAFFIFELFVFIKDPLDYIKSVFNWLDAFQTLMTFIVLFQFYNDSRDPELVLNNTLYTFLIFVSTMRSLSLFQIFDSVRYMVSMLVQVFKDMISFLLVFFISVGILGILHLQASRRRDQVKLGEFEDKGDEIIDTEYKEMISLKEKLSANLGQAYFLQFNKVYSMTYENWDNFFSLDSIYYMIFLLSTVFLAMVMVNFLIGVIEQTFGEFEEKKDIVDTKHMIEVLRDFNMLTSFFMPKFFDKTESSHVIRLKKSEEEEGNDIILSLIDEVDKNHEKLNEFVDDKIDEIEGMFKATESEFDYMRRDIENVLKEKLVRD